MWQVFSEERTTEDNVRYTAYGVRCLSYCIGDLCTDSGEIRRFADMLNTFEVSTLNAADIVEDYLAGGIPEEVMAGLAIIA